jgi:hypothetical protein
VYYDECTRLNVQIDALACPATEGQYLWRRRFLFFAASTTPTRGVECTLALQLRFLLFVCRLVVLAAGCVASCCVAELSKF